MAVSTLPIATEAPPSRPRGYGSPKWLGGVVGLVGLILVWWLLAVTIFADGGAVPTPWAVASKLVEDGWDLYGPNVTATVQEAAWGYLWGNAIAIGLALLVLLIPPLEAVAMQMAVMSYCMPIIAIGPILTIVFTGRTPMIALAAISVFFTTLVGTLLGLRAADATSIDLVRAYGGGRWQQLRRVQVIAALPSTFSALKIAAPAAVLGAIIGEFLGSVDNGLGLQMVIAQQQLEVARTWGVALVAGAVAGVGYGIVALIARVVTPWVAGQERQGT